MNEVKNLFIEICYEGFSIAENAYLTIQSNPTVLAAQPVIGALGVILGAISGYEIGHTAILRARGLWSPSLTRPVILLTAAVALGICATPYVAAAIATAIIGAALLGAFSACFEKKAPVNLSFNEYVQTYGGCTSSVTLISPEEFLNIENPTQKDVSGMVWGMMKNACEKGEGFTEGTFVLEGEQAQAIYDKLNGIKGAYSRASSHYKGRCDKSMGLDFSNEFILPASKRTILFGLADTHDNKKTLFIKPENWGADLHINSLDKLEHCVHHTVEFVFAQYVKIIRPGYDDVPGTAKERIPHKWSANSKFGWAALTEKEKQSLVDRVLAKEEWKQDAYRTGREVYIRLNAVEQQDVLEETEELDELEAI